MFARNITTYILYFLLPVVSFEIYTQSENSWTVLVVMAARNDLLRFADRNIEQMKRVGSNENLTILIHLDIRLPNGQAVTRRYVVNHGHLKQIGPDTLMDSGSPETLIDACRWAHESYPAKNFCLVLWNHGTGDLEPNVGKTVNSAKFFNYNPITRLIELDRSIEFIDHLNLIAEDCQPKRGICFDEITRNYLTNHQVGVALDFVCQKYRNGKKIDVLYCDACLMGALGFHYSIKNSVTYSVGSEEVVLATGGPYTAILAPLAQQSLDPKTFACHIVEAFDRTYSKITRDYTQAALNLMVIDPLYTEINHLAQLLIEGLREQRNRSVTIAIKRSSNKNACTSFEEPTYKDLYHFLSNLLSESFRIELINQKTNAYKDSLKQCINKCRSLITEIVVANARGSNLKNASGISIYLPEGHIHPSYPNTDFAQNNAWLQFLNAYVRS